MKKNLLIFGAGNHARVISELFKDKFNIIGYMITDKINKNNKLSKKIFLLNKSNFDKLKKNRKLFSIIAVGDNEIRKKIFLKLRNLKIKNKWISIISKNAILAKDVEIGEGTLVMPGCIINNGTKIKKHCIINTGSIIEHDNYFKNFSSCGPRVVTGGNVTLGEASYIGIGSVVREKIKIENNVIIGGNSFVNKNCDKNSLYYGSPIRLIK